MGVSYAKLDRLDDAVSVLKRAAAAEPDNPLVKQNLAGALARAGKLMDALPVYRQAASLAPGNPAIAISFARCLDQIGGDHRKEALSVYKDVAKRFPGTDFAEMAKKVLNEQASKDLHGAVSGGLRPDAVEYMVAAIKRFGGMPKEQVGQVVLEIARLGEQGLAVNTAGKRYTLDTLPGESFSGLQLMSYMHVGTQIFMPGVDAGTGLQREYEVAKGMAG